MLTTQYATFTRPQDKHGLLAYWREEKVPVLLKQLEAILTEHKAESILDLTRETDLYASRLRAHGWQVSTPQEIWSVETFDAVICMDNVFVQYQQHHELIDALRSMRRKINCDGIVIFCAPDFQPLLESPEEKEVTPLLLGAELHGMQGSVIRYMRHDDVMGRVVEEYIYHLKDLSTGNITADWETSVCELLYIEVAHAAIRSADGDIRGDYLAGRDRLYVYGNRPYVGPTSIRRNKD